MRPLTGLASWLFLLALAPSVAAQTAAECPPGSYRIGRGADFSICKHYGEKLPVVSPSQFIPGYEAADLKRRIAALLLKRKKYQDQLIKLERWAGQADRNARDMIDIQREVFSGNALHALRIISASVSMLANNKSLSPAAEQEISTAIAAVKTMIHTVLSRRAPAGSAQESEQAIEAAFEMRHLIRVSEKLIPAHEWKAFKSAINTLPKMLKISERYLRGEHQEAPLSTYLKHLDDVLAAGGDLFPKLKAMHSTAHIIDGEIALWLMRQDREAADDAFIKLKSAKHYYEKRLRETDKLLKFYKERQTRINVR